MNMKRKMKHPPAQKNWRNVQYMTTSAIHCEKKGKLFGITRKYAIF